MELDSDEVPAPGSRSHTEQTNSTTSPNNNDIAGEPTATSVGNIVSSKKQKTNSQNDVDSDESTVSNVPTNDDNVNLTTSSTMNNNSSTSKVGSEKNSTSSSLVGSTADSNNNNNQTLNDNSDTSIDNSGNNNENNASESNNNRTKKGGEEKQKKTVLSCVSFVLDEGDTENGYVQSEILQHNIERRQRRFPGKEFKVLISAVWNNNNNNNNNDISSWNRFNDYCDVIIDNIIDIGGSFNIIDANIISIELNKARKTIVVQCADSETMNLFNSTVFGPPRADGSNGVEAIVARARCVVETNGSHKTKYTALVPSTKIGGVTAREAKTLCNQMQTMLDTQLGFDVTASSLGYLEKKNSKTSIPLFGVEIEHDKSLQNQLPAVFGLTLDGSKIEFRAQSFLRAARKNKKPKLSLLSSSFSKQFSKRSAVLKTPVPPRVQPAATSPARAPPTRAAPTASSSTTTNRSTHSSQQSQTALGMLSAPPITLLPTPQQIAARRPSLPPPASSPPLMPVTSRMPRPNAMPTTSSSSRHASSTSTRTLLLPPPRPHRSTPIITSSTTTPRNLTPSHSRTPLQRTHTPTSTTMTTTASIRGTNKSSLAAKTTRHSTPRNNTNNQFSPPVLRSRSKSKDGTSTLSAPQDQSQ